MVHLLPQQFDALLLIIPLPEGGVMINRRLIMNVIIEIHHG